MSMGYRTEREKPTNHVLHLILSVLTFGLWVPVWIFMVLWHKAGPRQVDVVYPTGRPMYYQPQQQALPAQQYRGQWVWNATVRRWEWR